MTTAATITKQPIICGQVIEQVTADGKCRAHVTKRRLLAFGALAQMTLNGFITNSIHATVKARLFSTNIRPILSYGLENCDLNIGNKDMVRRTEGNIVKKMLSLPRNASTTPLFEALKLQSTEQMLKEQKINFLNRLQENSYTKSMLTQLAENNFKDSFLDEICKTLGYEPERRYSLKQLSDEANRQQNLIKINKISLKSINSERTAKIRQLFNIKSAMERNNALRVELTAYMAS